MNEQIKCLRCDGTNVTDSYIQSTGRIYSRPKDAKLGAILLTGVPVSAIVCLDCGHLDLVVEAVKAKSLIKAS